MNPLNFLSFNGEQSYQAEQEQLYESITLGNATAPSSNRRTGHYPPIGFAHATPFPARRLKCDHCNACFTNVEDLQVHTVKAHLLQTAAAPSSNHQIGNAPTALTQAGLSRSCRNKCNDCGACFTNVGDLQVHTLTAHHQEEEAAPPPYAGGFHFESQPINLESAIEMTGKFRGIQGENNSCYLDSSLMAMFYVNDTFDSLLVRSAGDSENDKQDSNELEYARMYMTLHIVNQLRQRGFVPSGLVVEWRRIINNWFGRGVDFDSHCEEEEACDFVRFLLERFGDRSVKFSIESTKAALASQKPDSSDVNGFEVSGEPAYAELTAKNTEVMFQLLTPPHPNGLNGAWTIDQLLSETLRSQDLVFTELQSSLILQLPRYGKRDRVIGNVVPDPSLHVHSSGAYRCKVLYQLRAIIVIGTSHFVTYLRVPKGSRDGVLKGDRSHQEYTWLYFDSMSDRVGERNVPLILDVSEELEVLETPNASALLGAEMAKPGRQHLRRVVQDTSMAFYCRVGSQVLEAAFFE
jgi:hypothetical protein